MASSDRVMPLIDNYIYIYHLNKFCVLPLYPESFSDSMNSTFNSTNALSRSAPIFTYQESGPRSISFNIKLHRDLMEDVNTNVSNLKDGIAEDLKNKDYIDILLNYLQACALPKYMIYGAGSKAVEPPQVAVRIGNDIFIKGVINNSVSVTYEKPILDNNKYGVVSVQFSVNETDPYDAPTVAQVGGFRGITATFKNGIYRDKSSDTLVYTLQEYTSNGASGEPAGDSNWGNVFDDYKKYHNKITEKSTAEVPFRRGKNINPVYNSWGPYASNGTENGYLSVSGNFNHYDGNHNPEFKIPSDKAADTRSYDKQKAYDVFI